MGKRELLIIAAFLVLGFGVYQATAPPADPTRPRFSLARFIDHVRSEIRGQRASAETTFRATEPVPDSIREIRLEFAVGAITIEGEDRDDIEAEMHVRSTGRDAVEAERLAKASRLTFDAAGEVLIIDGKFPVEGRQTPTLRLKVPSRLAVRIDDKGSTFEVKDLAAVRVGTGRGRTVIERIAGEVNVTQRGSEISITDAGSLTLATTSGADVRIARIRGDTALTLQSGDLRAEELGGSLTVEARNTEMQFARLDDLKGPVRVDATMGEVVFSGLRTEARINGRRAEIRVEHAGGAPLSIYNDGDETIEVTLPPGGFTMDAVATGGRISLDPALEEGGLEKEGDTAESDEPGPRDDTRAEVRVTGTVRGGGPAITLRATRGDILLRSRQSS